MKLTILTGVAMATALASGATAQEPPPTTGPYLWVQQEPHLVVIMATGTRRQTAAGWAATAITVFDVPDIGQVRADGTVEADCDLQVRRTEDLHLFPASDVDRPGGRLTTVPPMEWSPPGPLDGPVMEFLCEGTTHRSHVRDRMSEHVAAWRDGG